MGDAGYVLLKGVLGAKGGRARALLRYCLFLGGFNFAQVVKSNPCARHRGVMGKPARRYVSGGGWKGSSVYYHGIPLQIIGDRTTTASDNDGY